MKRLKGRNNRESDEIKDEGKMELETVIVNSTSKMRRCQTKRSQDVRNEQNPDDYFRQICQKPKEKGNC